MPYWVENVNGKGVVVGPFNSRPGGMNLTTLIGYPDKAQAQTAANALAPFPQSVPGVGGALTGINSVGDFFYRLTQPAVWLRAGEVLVGVTLVYVAARAMFPGQVTAAVAPVKGAVKGIAGKSILGAV